MNHPSIAKKTHKTKPQSYFQFSPLDGAQYANISTAPITTNTKGDYENNCNTKKVAPSFNQKMTTKQDPEESEQNYHIFQLKLKKCTNAK
jgi:hypothetical protein